MNAIKSLTNGKKTSERREKWRRYLDSLRYGKHVIFHPFDGFWDLTHEKRGSFAAATTFLVLFLATDVLQVLCTNFQFIDVPAQYYNAFEEVLALLIPFLLLCLSNWSATTLFDGKGRFIDIYITMCYALIPFVLIRMPLIVVSHMLGRDEMSFYAVLMNIANYWMIFLIFVGLMQVHDYGPLKTIIFIIVTILGLMIILFLGLVFLSLLSDAISYFVSLYRETAFRLN